jgi:hypothetical protein
MKKMILSVTAIAGLSMAGHAQTGDYLYFVGLETTITLNPGIYNITAYGAQGGGGGGGGGYDGAGGNGLTGGRGGDGSAPFNSVDGDSGGSGGGGGYGGGAGFVSYGGGGGYSGGGGGAFGSGGGGGSIIDSSAIAVLAEVSGAASPDDSPNGEIIITAVPEPTTLAWGGLGGLLSLVAFRRRK